ncbi:MAG: branched-chain-amino acid aminotransferase [Deltaproteobacteria bacterium]|nr:MAG: branched-chain-amino acid aminotransferase [Deltaproteobacteria bacterium]TNF29738.1 MAG: branched-chain-amino acid aminotransferase [Deltaproteobacteria bacterium]
MKININGNIVGPEEATISVFDRGFLFGDSIYEVTLTYDGVLYKIDEHLDRLWESASRLDMPISISRKQLTYQMLKTLKALNETRAYIRVVITRGEGEIGLDPSLAVKNNLVIITKKLPENPTWWYDSGVEMIVASVLRNPKESMDPAIKSGNYLNNVLAYSQAKKQGAFDAIMLNADGMVTEGTTNNIWIVKDGKLKTPPLAAGLLSGITRKIVLELAFDNKIPAAEENFTPEELKDADECFLTSSTKELVPITKIDGISIGSGRPGELTKRLHQIYRQHVKDYINRQRGVQDEILGDKS